MGSRALLVSRDYAVREEIGRYPARAIQAFQMGSISVRHDFTLFPSRELTDGTSVTMGIRSMDWNNWIEVNLLGISHFAKW
jgi:hypothetical protein